jgi:CheY-like chemotaxis protein
VTTKLLAVDDSKTMRKVLEITFAGETYDSTIVGSPEEALGAVRSAPPQIAVVDAHLGGSSGYDLCRQIKEAAPGVKVILLSSKQRPYDEGAGSAAGVDDHFDKPFDSSKFLTKVEEVALTAGAPAPVASAPAASAPAAGTPSRAAAPPPAAAPMSAPAKAPEAPAPIGASPSPPRVSAMQRPQAPPPRVADAPPVAEARPSARAVSAPVASVTSLKTSGMEDKLQAMGLTSDQVKGVLSLSREVVEQVVWEVVPALAETLIKEEIARLTSE